MDENRWIGIVEDNLNDTLKIGYCKVRIIGLHSTDSSKLPTSQLPDTLIAQSMDNSFSMPAVGEWVMGIYLDYPNKQQPVATNIIPGLVNNTTHVNLTGAQAAERQRILNSQPRPAKEEPTPPDQPSLPLTTRTTENSIIDYTNKMRAHACDVSNLVNLAVSKAKQFVQFIIRTIREGIIALLKALGISPGSSALVSFLKDLRAALKSITNFLNKIVKTIAEIAEVIRKIRGIIEYILSLPQRLIQFFRDCLNKLYAILAAAPFEIISGAQGELSDSVSSEIIENFVGVVKDTQQVIQTAVSVAAAPVAIIEAAYKPSGMSDQEKEQLIADTYNGLEPFKATNYTTI